MSTRFAFTASVLAVAMLGCASNSTDKKMAADNVYGKFPVTEKSYTGSKTNSVSYSGQIARHVLHDTLKKLADSGNGSANPALKAKMMSYYAGKDKNRKIIAPATKKAFIVAETDVDQISKGKNLIGKTYKGTITGMPNNMTGPELVKFWIDKASSAKKGYDMEHGYQYGQLISKFIMGAVSYNQAVDNYLDEKLRADNKPNNKPYKKEAYYTGKEHSWDEGFGYFGTPAHTLTLTARQVYEINKLGSKSKNPKEALKAADYNGDGKVNLKSEMTFGPAYYAAGLDSATYNAGNQTTYLTDITTAFLNGRKLIASANGKALTDAQRATLRGYASTINDNWTNVLAEAAHRYAGLVHKDMEKIQTIIEAKGNTGKALKAYIKHWGELKGFALALQTGKTKHGATSAQMNRLIGVGPLMPNLQQVVDIDKSGNYVKAKGPSWGAYQANMAKVQKQLVKTYGIRAREHDVSGK